MEKKAEKQGLIIKLMDPFTFDGAQVKELDLTGLYTLTGNDLVQIDDQMLARGYSGQNVEMTKIYAMLTVAKVMKKPWEFCNEMKARDIIRIKNFVTNFFYTRNISEEKNTENS